MEQIENYFLNYKCSSNINFYVVYCVIFTYKYDYS